MDHESSLASANRLGVGEVVQIVTDSTFLHLVVAALLNLDHRRLVQRRRQGGAPEQGTSSSHLSNRRRPASESFTIRLRLGVKLRPSYSPDLTWRTHILWLFSWRYGGAEA